MNGNFEGDRGIHADHLAKQKSLDAINTVEISPDKHLILSVIGENQEKTSKRRK